MKNVYVLSVLLLFVAYFSYCQSSQLDSLFKVLEKENEDSIKVDILDAIGEAFFDQGELDSSYLYLEKAIHLANLNNLDQRKLRAIYLLNSVLSTQGKDSLALQYLTSTKKDYDKAGIEYDRFFMHLNLAYAFESNGNVQKAASHFDSAETFLLKTDIQQVHTFNLNLAGFLWNQKKYEDAKQLYTKNIQLARQMKDSIQLYFSYADLGLLYNDLQKPDSGVYYLEMSIPVIKKEDPHQAACLQSCLGTNYKSLGNYEQALNNFQESMANFKNPDLSFECSSYADMAICYLHLGETEKANHYNDLAIGLLPQISNLKLKRDALKEIVSLYKMQGNFERALLNMESLKKLEDELFTTENNAALEELQVKYQTREQQSQIELQNLRLNRQRIFILATFGLLLLLLAVLFLGWKNVRYRQKTNKLLSERNDQLKELDQKKSRFFSNISHELRTPLTLISAPLEEVFEDVRDKEIKENLLLAYRNSQKLLSLVDEILDLSKLESGQMKLDLSPIHLEEVLRRIFFAFQSLANIRRLKLDFKSHIPEDLWVETDLPKLEKILNNLVSNAIKYSDPGGQVSMDLRQVSTTTDVQNFIIQVTDNGKGIDQEDLPKIFDRYYQSNSGRLVGGTGIGLALCKELVHLFAGNIHVTSKKGKGSSFVVLLPLTVVQKRSTRFESPDKPLSNKKITDQILSKNTFSKAYTPILMEGQRPKILIVEDNPEMSRFLNQTLSPHYECAIAFDGNEALRQLESSHFDLVTSDVMMPQLDGFEFLEIVRREGKVYKNVPFILLTARSLEEDKLDGFRLGVDDYITKPFSVKELKARIQNLLKNKVQREKWVEEESVDRKLLKDAERIVMDHYSDPAFGVSQLSSLLAMSQRSLERFIKRLTGLSPVGFIREIRLLKAYQLLKRRQFLTVTEVRYEVGIENASYFNRKFKERFGINPKEVLGPVLKREFS